jgi:hypothetical protein
MQRLATLWVVLIMLGGCKSHRSAAFPSQTQSGARPTWDAKAIGVAAFLVANDFDELVDGNQTLLKSDDLATMAHVGIITHAKDYENDFDSNEIAADRKYANKKIMIYGKVDSTNEDALGDGYFSLNSSPFKSVQAHIANESIEQAATIKRGDTVVLVCDPGVRVIGFANLSNCLFLNQYLAKNHFTPQEQVQGFFGGTVALSSNEFKEVIMSYAMAQSPIIPASCLQAPDKQSCDVVKWKWNKADQKRLGDSLRSTFQHLQESVGKTFRRVSCSDPSVETPADASSCIMTTQ